MLQNVVLIGKKPVMNYVIACLTIFNSGASKVTIKARGRAISHAVDTVELLRRAFVKDLEIQKISTDTQELTLPEGDRKHISTINITISRPSKPSLESLDQ